MKLGLWLTARYEATRSPEEHFRAMREQVLLARDAGFGMISSGQHHLAPRLQTLPLLARLMAEADGLEAATSILLLPLHHPVDVAEESATMNAMLDDRFVLGLGLGHDPLEQAAYRVSPGDRAARFDEALAVMRLVWAGTGAPHDGRFFTLPAQPPRPPTARPPRMWVGGNGAAARQRAAAAEAAWFPSGLDVDALVAGRAEVRQLIHDRQGSLAPDEPAGLFLLVADTDERAQERAREVGHLDHRARRPGYIIGSSGTCLEAMLDYRDRGGLSHLLCRLEVPGMEQRDVLRQIESIGTTIIPELQRA